MSVCPWNTGQEAPLACTLLPVSVLAHIGRFGDQLALTNDLDRR